MVVHQDQGSQFMSYMYCAAVLALCRISFSTKGTPTDNADQESFFGRFKDELRIEIADLESIEAVKRFVKKRIEVYNEERIHTSIGYVTPKMFTDYILKNDKKRFSLFRT